MYTLFLNRNQAIQNYLDNEQLICAQYPDAFIILYRDTVSGPYTTVQDAYRAAFARHEIGTFLVKFCGNLAAKKHREEPPATEPATLL